MAMIEGLEQRTLFTANVTSVTADNRGEVQIRLDEGVTGVNKNSVKVYTSGTDGTINTADDVRVTSYSVGYDSATKRITVRANIPAAALYRVRVQSEFVRSTVDGSKLDGEFSGAFPTGNNESAGNFNFSAKKDRSSTPRLRMATSAGNIDVQLRGDLSGIETTVLNFIRYANAGRLDGTIFHRKITDAEGGIAIVQGGGYYSDSIDSSTGQPSDPVPAYNQIPLQAGVLSNLGGTISMARLGGNDPDTATSQFFFNANDNTELDPTNGTGGYAVFGNVANASSLAAVTTIYNATNVSVDPNYFNTLPRIGGQDVVLRRAALLDKIESLD